MKLMGPGILGSSVAQINLLFDTLIASFLVAGSVSWLYYSDRLVEFPLGVFAIALSTVILPSLSRSHANDSAGEFSHTVDWGLRLVLLVGIPSAVGLFLLARPMLATLFQYGDFGAADVSMAGMSLMAYAAGLPGFMLVKVLAPAFYTRKDPRTPVRIAIIALVTNMLLNMVFVVPMVLLDIPAPHAGLALATSIAAWVNAGLLLRTLKNRQIYRPQAGWPRLFLQLALAAGALAALLLWAVPAIAAWSQWSAGLRAANLVLWVVAGAGIYFVALRVSGVDMKGLWRHVHPDADA
jgi:putative peptidoglycan lipid II flippase